MKKNKFLLVYTLLVYLFLLIPLVIIVMTSFNSAPTISFPITGFSLSWYGKALRSQSFLNAFLTSLQVSSLATLCSLVIGIPVATYLSQHKHEWLKRYFLSPALIPGIVLGFALLKVVVVTYQISTLQALLIGHMLIVLPYVIRVVLANLEHFDYSIVEAAISLGTHPKLAFMKVILPNIISGIIAASLLGFINSFNNVPLSMFLSGDQVSLLPIHLMNFIEYTYDPTVSAISVLLMIMSLILMICIEKIAGISSTK